MASEILGLFGGKSPQQLRNAALDSMSISPAQMGSQGLLQQIVSMGQNAGAVTGMGAGRLLGGRVAGEVEASYLEDAIKSGQAGKTPTEKMKLVAAALEDKPGMGAQYMKALTEARRLEAEDFTMEQAKEKSNRIEVKRQVDTFDPYTGKITGQRTATVTQQWTGERDKRGNKIYADVPGQDGSTQPPPEGGGGASNAKQGAQAALDKLNAATEGQSNAPKTLGGTIDAAEEKARMDALTQEADIERAGYNSAAKQVAKQDRLTQKQTDVDRLTPAIIRMLDEVDARRIFRENFEFLNDEQKRELRKRIAAGSYGRPRRPPALSAPPGDITGSRLL